tara:strand:+ start:784 stop:1020 length:237 start_codon:yes stop_codon:yes gene_type:complete
MRAPFIAHHRTIAKRKAQAFSVMLASFLCLGTGGIHLLFGGADLFENIVGIMLLAITTVGLPWSLIGLIWSIGDYREG